VNPRETRGKSGRRQRQTTSVGCQENDDDYKFQRQRYGTEAGEVGVDREGDGWKR